jgi:aspartate aminotransferase
MQFAARTKLLEPTAIRKLMPFAQDAKSQGVKVYPLNIGQPDIRTPKEFFEAVRNFTNVTEVLEYGQSKGDAGLIAEIAAYYNTMGVPFNEDDIIISSGGNEALYFIFLTLLGPEDEILIPEPFYANYKTFAAASGGKIIPIPTLAEDGFHLPSKETIENLITSKTRAILINNPGNPTGAIFNPSEMQVISNLAQKHKLFIIADEVYREFTYDGTKSMSFGEMGHILNQLIIVDSISKRFSACGARVGCAISKNKEFMGHFMKFCQGRGSSPTMEQVGGVALYKFRNEDYFNEVRREYSTRRDVLHEALLSVPGVVCRKPQGAFYMLAKLPVDDAEKFATWMIKSFRHDNSTVLVAPAYGFYATPGKGLDEVRMAYVLKKEELEKAANVLSKALKAYPGRI